MTSEQAQTVQQIDKDAAATEYPYCMNNAEYELYQLKCGLAKMLKGGVIMDVVNVEQAKVAENAGACAVMALERVPSDIRAQGGVARMSDPGLIRSIKQAVTIPVMAKVRIGHFVEAQMLEALGVDFIDESEVLTPADPTAHIDKRHFRTPFVCGCRDLGEALRRIHEGAVMVRTKGEAGTGNVAEAVRHIRMIHQELNTLQTQWKENHNMTHWMNVAEEMRIPWHLLKETLALGRLPVVNMAAGGIATPADAALMMQLKSQGVFVGSGIFKSERPDQVAAAMVQAVVHYNDPSRLVQWSTHLGKPMQGLDVIEQKWSLTGL